jgi:hypothetical protein
MRYKAKAPIDAPDPLGVDNFFLYHVKALSFCLSHSLGGEIHPRFARKIHKNDNMQWFAAVKFAFR